MLPDDRTPLNGKHADVDRNESRGSGNVNNHIVLQWTGEGATKSRLHSVSATKGIRSSNNRTGSFAKHSTPTGSIMSITAGLGQRHNGLNGDSASNSIILVNSASNRKKEFSRPTVGVPMASSSDVVNGTPLLLPNDILSNRGNNNIFNNNNINGINSTTSSVRVTSTPKGHASPTELKYKMSPKENQKSMMMSRERQNKASKILDFLYVGSIDDAFNTDFICHHGITDILNVSSETYNPPLYRCRRGDVGSDAPSSLASVTIHNVIMYDCSQYLIRARFDECFAIIDSVRKKYYTKFKELDKLASFTRHKVIKEYEKQAKMSRSKVNLSQIFRDVDNKNVLALANLKAYPVPQLKSSEAQIFQQSTEGVQGDSYSIDDDSDRSAQYLDEMELRSLSQEMVASTKRSMDKNTFNFCGFKGSMIPPRILVHCQKGLSRSVTIVAAYLIKCNGCTAYEALCFLGTFRPCIEPNVGFLSELQRWQVLQPESQRKGNLADLSLLIKGVNVSWSDEDVREFMEREVGRVWFVGSMPGCIERRSTPPTGSCTIDIAQDPLQRAEGGVVMVSFSSKECVLRALALFRDVPERFVPLEFRRSSCDDDPHQVCNSIEDLVKLNKVSPQHLCLFRHPDRTRMVDTEEKQEKNCC